MRTFRPLIALALAAALAVGVAGCGSNDVAAIVNGEEISKAELEAQVDRLMEQSPQMFEGDEGEARLVDFKRQLLDNMINNVLIRQAAAERGISVTDEEIDAQIADLKAGFPSEEEFDTALANANLTLDDLKQQLRDQLATQRLMEDLVGDDEVTDAEIEEYYEANKAQYEEQAAVKASHILFDPEDKATAEDVLAQVNNGGDFAELAKEHSKDPGSAAQGGDLGWSDPARPFVTEFQDALEALEVGEISELVETEYGWHIIKVDESREQRTKPLDEVSEQIEQQILQQRNITAYQEFLAEVREAADIEILIDELKLPEAEAEDTPATEEAPAE
ncbi:MAG: peptidylprolyl isomerase [Anaerosomatales bacterium]|nr:peptidylprolyl isomerase [Anaerosomatales bacterium]MDT8434142.1 peptidylprolyl isomerase [Anaerosomatales bacterium]